ncbi:MAG: hypothetical protein KGD68_01360 [Candidatus Lokiarchaeota archaeon]|nr:hypothetical protein [Candidatus Lokiarchaeota archaeon]
MRVVNNLLINEIVHDDRIREIINSDYKNDEIVNLMRNITKEAIESNPFYKELANKENFNLDDLNKIDDLALIPRVPAPLFKESTGMYEKLLKIPLKSPEFELWNVSSCTSGDPSLVGRSKDDIELLASMTIKCIYEFIPIPEDEWFNTISFDFAPSVTFLNRIAMRYTKVRPIKLYGSILHEISTRMSNPKFLIKFFILKAFKEIIKKHGLAGAFGINSKYVINEVRKNSEKPVNKQKHISFGGSLQLLNIFMNKIMKEKNLKFDLPDSVVNFGGGEWNVHKSQLKHPPIDKTKFISDCVESFGTKSDRITDMFGFTETPITFGSHWSDKHQDFIFHCPSQARIIIRDLNTLDPLKKAGDRGFLEVLTPFGVAASVNHAVIVDDLVELVSKNKCPECGYQGDTFIVHGRIEDKQGLGCSSIIEWI